MILCVNVSAAEQNFWVKTDAVYEAWTKGSKNSRLGTDFQIGYKFHDNWSVDVKQYFRINSYMGSSNNRFEGALSYEYDIFRLRMSVGERYYGNVSNRYIGVEPTLIVPVTKNFNIGAGYRFRTENGPTFDDETNAMFVTSNYKFHENFSVNAGLIRSWGKQYYYSPSVGITAQF